MSEEKQKRLHACQREPFPQDGLVTKAQVGDFVHRSERWVQRKTAEGLIPKVKSPFERFVRYDAAVIRALFGESESMQQPSVGGA